MNTILDTIQEFAKKDPDAAVLFDDAHVRGITYAQFSEMTGRVYGWLKSQGIQKEDFVLINLPRGVLSVVAMFGVWKAGAAWTVVEDGYAPERIDYIRKDCGCKTEITGNNWDLIMHTKPLSGHEDVNAHDAAFAVYTSGSTGNPKGVLHEYGNLQMITDGIRVNREEAFTGDDRLAMLSPMNFVATVSLALKVLSIFRMKFFIVSYTTSKNPTALAKFFKAKGITIAFLPPSYVRILRDRIESPMRLLFVGGEPANALYDEKLTLVNIYASSENAFPIGVFKIDKAYDACPIGNPQIDVKIMLVDEDGNEVADGETGELCVEDPFVRGYINLPEENKKAFVDGFLHTGDLARKDENGDYVLLGRSGDMIKINGNRIEPAEIEAAIKAALQIDWAAARGFDENGKSFLCAYYLADIEVDAEKLRQELSRRLPYYMIPSYFIKIDSIPKKASGKMDRRALPAPDMQSFVSDYVAPTNATEKILCDMMAKVLKLSQVSIHDDFYVLGGDSLASIELTALCEDALPGLNTGLIFRGRTPEKIALLYMDECAGNLGDPDEQNEAAMKRDHSLTTEQLYMIDYQLYTPNSTMYNLFSMMKVEKADFDLEKLAAALETAISSHPALLTTFAWNEDGEMIQRYTPEIAQKVYVDQMSEFELRFVKDTLVYPFKIAGGRLYRCRVFETEKSGYVFFDVHHSLFDGTSLKVFWESVGKAYRGEAIEPDYYYLMLQRRENVVQTAFYEESKKYFEDRYDEVAWASYPKIDHDSRENEMGELTAELEVLPAQLSAMERAYQISRNEFFITVAALAISIYNQEPNIKLSWIYNGREDKQNKTTVGLLFRDLPVGLQFQDTDTLRNVFSEVANQVQKGIEHSCYPYVDARNHVADGESAYLLYQQDIRDMNELAGHPVKPVEVRQNRAASQTILDLEILDGADGLQLLIDFAASRYEKSSIERFKDIFVKLSRTLVTYHSQADVTIGEIKAKLGESSDGN